MKSKILLRCSLLAFFAGLAVLIATWNGKASIQFSWPIKDSVVQLSGSATGWRAMAGFGGFVLAVVLFFWGLISLITRGLRGRGEEPLADSQPAPEAKKETASSMTVGGKLGQ